LFKIALSWVPVSQWLTFVILATQKAEIRRIVVQGQAGQIVHEILSRKILHKNRADGVAQGEGPEFKPQYHKKKIALQEVALWHFHVYMY
jgi:hypothetical protein